MMISRRDIWTLFSLLCVACGDSPSDEDSQETITLRVYGSDVSVTDPEGLIFAGRFTALTNDNPSAFVGDSHLEDPVAQSRLDEYIEATASATQIVIRRADAAPSGVPLYEVAGCVPNPTIHDEMADLGLDFCATTDFGTAITFANVQMARIAPNGPFDIYEDYVVNALPIFLNEGGCVTGAWLCDDAIFDGVFVPSYRSPVDIQTVSATTETSGPGGEYGDATFGDIRRGGVEINVRTLLDVGSLPTGS